MAVAIVVKTFKRSLAHLLRALSLLLRTLRVVLVTFLELLMVPLLLRKLWGFRLGTLAAVLLSVPSLLTAVKLWPLLTSTRRAWFPLLSLPLLLLSARGYGSREDR